MFLDRRCPGCDRQARFVCASCVESFEQPGVIELAGLDEVRACFDYEGAVAKAVRSAKNGGRRDLLRFLGRPVAQACVGLDVDAVTWVPASPGNRRQRGYDQGRALASVVSRSLGEPALRLLTRRGLSQMGQSRDERLAGIDLWPARPAPKSVLLLDDVVTTGASLCSAAAVLRFAGAEQVFASTIAATGWPAMSRENA